MAVSPTLEQQLCFALYSASRAMTARYRPLLDELGLTYPQYLVLLALYERDGRTVKELGEELRLDSGTLSPLLKRMAAAGLLRRTRSADDERSVVVELTDEGAALRGRVAEVPGGLFRDTDVTVAEIADLRARLQDFLARI
ncbi:MarR family transcriptional regulator [Actinokineospora fastidiosa]|uniref:MarR family transcriptional regulator n=2 Tax=Pseudonocardiaceae TaxID=2070 RepID=A0A918GHH5_9PSEU|nr:Organic hydroperoxide resistance transcriptional regulator [Actinokineospora sp. UTMC 2448]GGS36925.1 MarR family transcriptional regulator [Actinokineospora fastidiosa]